MRISREGGVLVAAALAGLIARLSTLPAVIEHHDGLAFARGVESFSIAADRPFWPGYPVYIALGKVVNAFVGDAARALHLLGAAASALTAWPLGRLAAAMRRALGGGETDAVLSAAAAAFAFALSPLAWVAGSEIFSDSVGLVLASGAAWCAWRATAPPDGRGLAAAAGVLAGLTLGARLALWPLLLVPWALFGATPHAARLRRRFAAGTAAAMAVWMAALAIDDAPALLANAGVRLRMHRAQAGNMAVADRAWASRPVRAAALVMGPGFGGFADGGAPGRTATTVAVLWTMAAGARRAVRGTDRRPVRLLSAWLLVYAGAVLVLHDPGYPRYALPLLAGLALLAALGLPGRPALAGAGAGAVLAGMAAVSIPLARVHAEAPRTGHAAAAWVRRHVPDAYVRIPVGDAYLPYFLGQHHVRYGMDPPPPGAEMLSSFAPPHEPERWVPVAKFCRSLRLETRGPREVWLFRRRDGQGGTFEVPPCS